MQDETRLCGEISRETIARSCKNGFKLRGSYFGGKMARVTGLEPATSGVTGRRSNQLSYTPVREESRIGHSLSQVKRGGFDFL
jgi:hypothetical protein